MTRAAARAIAAGLCLLVAGASAQSARVVLRWKAAAGAVSYELQIAKDAQFTAVVVKQTVSAPAWRWEELPGDTYYWRVRSLDGEGRASEWSEARVINSTTVSPTAASPAPGASVACTFDTQEFTVEPSAVIKDYVLELSSDANFSSGTREVHGPGPAFRVSGLAPGTWWWRVRGTDLEGRQTDKSPGRVVTVTLAAPKLKGPFDAVLGAGITLQWSDVPCATGWRVELVRDGVESLTLDAPGPSQVFRPTATGDFKWKVAAVDFHGVSSAFSAEGLLRVRLAAPALKAENVQGGVELRWAAVEKAAGYRVEVSANDDFKAPVQQATVAGTAWQGTLPPGRYLWRVMTRDGAGRASAPSEVRRFEVPDPTALAGLAPPALAEPELDGGQATLRWSAVAGAVGYQLRLVPDGGPEQTTDSVTTEVTLPLAPGPWQVAVAARGAPGARLNFSEPRALTVREPTRPEAPRVPIAATARWRASAFFGGRFNGGAITSPTGALSFGWTPAPFSVEARVGLYGAGTTLPLGITAHAQLLPLSLLLGFSHWFGPLEVRGGAGFLLQLTWLQQSTGARQFAALPGFEVCAGAGYAIGPGLMALELNYQYARLSSPTARLNAGGFGLFLGYALALPVGGS